MSLLDKVKSGLKNLFGAKAEKAAEAPVATTEAPAAEAPAAAAVETPKEKPAAPAAPAA